MGRKILTVGGGLIALYLIVAYGTGFAKGVNASASGGANLIKAFQGR